MIGLICNECKKMTYTGHGNIITAIWVNVNQRVIYYTCRYASIIPVSIDIMCEISYNKV